MSQLTVPTFQRLTRGVADSLTVYEVHDALIRRVAAKYALDVIRIGYSTKKESALRDAVVRLAADREGKEYMNGQLESGFFHLLVSKKLGPRADMFIRTFTHMYDVLQKRAKAA